MEATPQGDSLDKVLQIVQAGGVNATGSVRFFGHDIQMQFVITVLSIKGIDIRRATIEDISDVLYIYINLSFQVDSNKANVPEGDVVTLQFILQFLEDDEANHNGNFYFHGFLIQTQFIVEVLKIQNTNVETLTISELYYIFLVYVGHQIDYSGNQPQPSVTDSASLVIVLEELKVQGNTASGAVQIEEEIISFEYIVSILNIRNDDDSSVTTQELWLIIQLAIQFHKQTNSSETLSQETLIFFLAVISNTEDIGSSVLVVNGTRVSVQSIIIELGLQIDSSTGKYDTSSLTAEILIEAIVKISNSSGSSTSTTSTTTGE